MARRKATSWIGKTRAINGCRAKCQKCNAPNAREPGCWEKNECFATVIIGVELDDNIEC